MNRSAVQTLTLPNGGSHLAEYRQGSIDFVGTSTAIIRYAGFTILTDPNFLQEQLPPVDLVIVSHVRGDHFKKLSKSTPIVTTKQSADVLKGLGFERAYALRTWEPFEVFKGESRVRITAMPGKCPPRLLRLISPPDMGSVLEFASGEKIPLRMYVTGHTLIHEHLKEIPRRYINIDVALLHLGGTMDAKQGVEAIRIVNPHTAIPIHPLDNFKRAVREAGLEERVHYLAHGETFDIEVPEARL